MQQKFREQPHLLKKYFLLLVLVFKITFNWCFGRGGQGHASRTPELQPYLVNKAMAQGLWKHVADPSWAKHILTTQPKTPQTCCRLSILPACCNLSKVATSLSISSSCNKSVKITLVATCNLQTFYNLL